MKLTRIFKGGCHLYYCASDKDKHEPEMNFSDYAKTLLSAVFHGVNNFGVNAVIEIYEVKDEVILLGGIGEKKSNGNTQFFQQHRVYDTGGVSTALNSSNIIPNIVDCVAMRGRGENNKQQLEINSEGIVNTITTCTKDNMVLVRQATTDGAIPCKIGGGGGLELSRQQDTKRKGDRERRDLPDSDNGEYP